jgi:hypothetical protein
MEQSPVMNFKINVVTAFLSNAPGGHSKTRPASTKTRPARYILLY